MAKKVTGEKSKVRDILLWAIVSPVKIGITFDTLRRGIVLGAEATGYYFTRN
jgi:hypothetical protein